jgi:hypothetical protein
LSEEPTGTVVVRISGRVGAEMDKEMMWEIKKDIKEQ